MTFQPSPQQSAIFSGIAAADHNILVDAKAGSGKTTTILEGMKHIPRGTALLAPSVVFLTFSKSIADTLQARCPRGTRASTFSSLGLSALRNSGLVKWHRELVAGNKYLKYIWNAMDFSDPDCNGVKKLVDLQRGCWPAAPWAELTRYHDVPLENPSYAFEVAQAVLDKGKNVFDPIDFNDMLYLPIVHNCHFDPQDWIFVDEAQDTNDIQVEILDRLERQETTRYCAVGDPFQSIYGFRGANSDAMEKIGKRFSCVTYPLSVSYRCPKAVVKEAQRYLR